MSKGVIHAGKGTSLSSGNANENERRGWNEETYRRKNSNPLNNYDWSRHHLNFEVVDGAVRPLGSQEFSLYERYQNTMAELDYKEYKDGATNKQHSYVELIVSGSTERMRKIAFGDQKVDFSRNPEQWRNWNVTRTKDIEKWAVDVFDLMCDRYGKENIIGFEVHLDETAPHIHCNIVPTAIKKRRGNVGGYIKMDADGNPMTYTKGKHVGEIIKISAKKYEALSEDAKKNFRRNERGTVRVLSFATHFGDKSEERSEKMSQLHTELYERVGKKWGLERGDVLAELSEEERRARKHLSKQERKALDEAEGKKEKLESITSTMKKEIDDLDDTLLLYERNKADMEDELKDLLKKSEERAQMEKEIANKRAEHTELENKIVDKKEKLSRAEAELDGKLRQNRILSDANQKLRREKAELEGEEAPLSRFLRRPDVAKAWESHRRLEDHAKGAFTEAVGSIRNFSERRSADFNDVERQSIATALFSKCRIESWEPSEENLKKAGEFLYSEWEPDSTSSEWWNHVVNLRIGQLASELFLQIGQSYGASGGGGGSNITDLTDWSGRKKR